MNVVLGIDFSGGHLYPALIFARSLKNIYPQINVVFAGVSIEQKRVLEEEGFISVSFCVNFRQIVLESFLRFFEAIYILLRFSPSRVYGFGGRSSFLLVLIASFFLPTYVYEPNVSLGKANRILVHFCRRIFRGIREEKASSKEIQVGIPLRKEITTHSISVTESRLQIGLQADEKYFTVFVFGGSQGSQAINEIVINMLKFLDRESFQFIHITGWQDREKVENFYEKYNFSFFCRPFFNDMGLLYRAADMVICRGGASTLAEINFFCLPAVVIPYPYASGHQEKNARFLAKKGCVIVEDEKVITPSHLGDLLKMMRNNKDIREELIINQQKTKIWTEAKKFFSLLWQ